MVRNRVRKIVVTGAAVAAIGGISFGASAFASTSGASHPATAPAAAPGRPAGAPAPHVADHLGKAAVRATAPAVVSQLIGHGTVDGTPWSVTLEFHATLPKGFKVGTLPPGMPKQPARTSLLCQRMVIGGIRIDHQGGPWADCQPVDGTHDPSGSGEAGLWGLHDKGTTGSRLFVSNPEANVSYGVVTLTDGERLTAHVVAVPHTSYRAWAVAIPDNRTIASVDEFDAHHHRVSHQTEWR
ncbi:hypothetical protein AB0M29_26960 [Streptomyces sp. NPDC051976]|uniref:hypothetical protein n=1 Tax=Streptomyces sp. NPDC051976 TaxID=3154947 RepID=UPI00343DCBEC